ncbi:MAG: hypothetical protein N2449_01800 [Bacteroidales bacterium]|nr:hypothetical protein [Bacteroidales bacterium]
MKLYFVLIFAFLAFIVHAQKVQIVPSSQLKDSNIKTVKVITNKEEFKNHFGDSLKFKTLLPYVNIPQTKIWIAPPYSYKYSERINGFIHLATTTSITCTEIKGFHFTRVVENITNEKIAKQNATIKSIEDVQTTAGFPAKMVTISFSLPSKEAGKEIPFERLMLFTGDLNNTVWVNATYPEAVKPFVYEMVRKSLLSVKYDLP